MTTMTTTTAAPDVEFIERFELIYRESQGDAARIPWAHARPCPSMVAWLNAEAPNVIRPGARVAVIGCGLGEDASALAERGYDVTAFDVCPSAIEHARRRRPEHAGIFTVADVLDLPGRMKRRYDLAVEVHTLQSLPRERHADLARGMADLLSHRGLLLAIARGRPEDAPADAVDGPPWPLTPAELESAMAHAGLAPTRALDDFLDDNTPPVRRIRGVFRRVG